MFAFTKLSNIIRIRFTAKISFKMPKQGRHTDKGSPPTIVYLSRESFSLVIFHFFLCTILYKRNTSEISFLLAQNCVVFLNLPEFTIKPYCLLPALPKDSPNCEKHNDENNSHEREYDIRKDLNFRIVLAKNVMQSFFETELSEKMQRTCYATKTKETCERERLAYSTSELVSLERETKRHL